MKIRRSGLAPGGLLGGLLMGISTAALAADPGKVPTEPAPADTGAPDQSPASEGGTEPAAATESGVVELETIFVTATRRKAALRDLPESIFAIRGKDLEDEGASELRDVLREIPGVQQTEVQPDLFRVSIRGIDSDVGGNIPAATGVFIDDVPFNDPFLNLVRPDLALFDLDGIEVLKGPQGTLFGGSALAGAVRYKLADAVPGRWEVKSFGQYQSVEDGSSNRVGGAAVNVPFAGDRAALRLVGVRRLYGGVIDDLRNDVSDTDRSASYHGRALLHWDVSEQLTVKLKALRQRTRSDDVPFTENTEGRLERERALLPKSVSVSSFNLYGLDLSFKQPWGEIVSSSNVLKKYGALGDAYGERLFGAEDAGNPIGFPQISDVEGLVQEIRVLSPEAGGASWQWLVGAFANDYEGKTRQSVYVETPATGERTELLHLDADIEAQELALFGEASRNLGPRWRLTLGARAYSVETEGSVVTSGLLVGGETRNDGDIRKTGVNPRFALQYEVSENAASYLGIARGFRFGGIQINGPTAANPDVPETYSPDSVWNYELGLRTQWLDNRLQADGALFYIDWTDPQVQTVSGGEVPLSVLGNAGGARSYGAEFATRYLPPIEGLELELSASYTDAEITEAFAAPGGETVPDGARLPGYADVQARGAISYRWQVGNNRFEALATHVFQGDGVSDILQSQEIYDHPSTDLRLAIGNAGLAGRPKLSFGVTNLTDKRAVVSAIVISEDNFTTVYNRPRTFDLRLDLSF
ncbi:MAG: TonB-dependent receptor [Panacagrimonas sp.]